jgi:ABC-2 type transport system permease protein
MNIYLRELKMSVKSVITWSISISVIVVIFMSLFSGFSKDAGILDEALSKMPKELLMAFGMNTIDMSTVLGFFSLIFLFCQICLAIQASNYGFGLVSLEERDMTADFLLAKPVKRSGIMTSKLLAAFTALTITNIVTWITTFICLSLFVDGKPYDTKTLILLLASIVAFQLFFLSVGMLISLFLKKVRSVTPLSMALAFGMYVINAFGNLAGKANLELISPFKHFEAGYIIQNSAYNMPLVLVSLSVIVVSLAGSYFLYAKRNIRSAV